jgi:hypothetical protein
MRQQTASHPVPGPSGSQESAGPSGSAITASPIHAAAKYPAVPASAVTANSPSAGNRPSALLDSFAMGVIGEISKTKAQTGNGTLAPRSRTRPIAEKIHGGIRRCLGPNGRIPGGLKSPEDRPGGEARHGRWRLVARESPQSGVHRAARRSRDTTRDRRRYLEVLL